MNYRGADIYCSDCEPGRCLVIVGNISPRYFENQAAAEAFVDAVLAHDDDGYQD